MPGVWRCKCCSKYASFPYHSEANNANRLFEGWFCCVEELARCDNAFHAAVCEILADMNICKACTTVIVMQLARDWPKTTAHLPLYSKHFNSIPNGRQL